MYKTYLLCCFVAIFGVATGVSAQRHYVCYYTAEKPVIDGAGNERVWQQASWSEDFVDIEGDLKPLPPLRTRTKMLWDKEYLYIYAELEEPDLWGSLHQHDTIVYLDNDFEVFIDPDNDTHDYFELEFNALNTEMDLFLDKPYRNGGKALLSWDAQGLRSAVQTRGTLNRPGDTDQGWSVEMAIPLKSIGFWGSRAPRDSTQWRIDFSRVEWDRDIKDGQYIPKVDAASGRRLPEHNWVWSPQGIIDMHAPERWGYLQFSTHMGGRDTVAFVPPADAEARKLLWQVYDAQKKYFKAQGHYAASLQALDIPEDSKTIKGEVLRLKLEGTSVQFTVTVNSGVLTDMLTVDQDGKVGRAGEH